MRIAFFTDSYLPQVNGVATSIANLAEELGRRGHKVMIFTPTPTAKPTMTRGAKAASFPNVEVVHLRSVPLLFYPELRLSLLFLHVVFQRLHRFRPDVIHVHTLLTVGLSGVLAARMLRVPLIGTNHVYLTKDNIDFFEGVYDSELLRRALARFSRHYMHAFYSRCKLVLTPSHDLAAQMKRDGFKKPLKYLSNGICLSKFRIVSANDRIKMRKSYGLKGQVVLHVGRLSIEKSVDELIRAFALLAAKKKDVSLLIVGDGPAMGDLKKLVAELALKARVVFAGMIPHQTLVSSGILSIGDLFATASTMEAQGVVVLEAMSSGQPLVCVGEAGVTELVDGNGLLAKPHDIRALARHMQKILGDDNLRKRMSTMSLARADAYSVERVADTVLGYYEGAA